jgi:hypothetical protein
VRAFASSFHAWKSLERQEGIKVPHGLVFPLAVVGAIGAPHGLELFAEECTPSGPIGFDAIMISVLDSRCMVDAAKHFARWRIPFRRRDRVDGQWPLVWAGGQGLHNPLPMAEVFDLCVIGDAEDPLPALLALWDVHGNGRRFLDEAAVVPGVFVPSVHDRRRDRIVQSIASDVSVTLRNVVDVSHNMTRRIEIARGCKFKCAFCSLGWRTPVRENAAEDVLIAIRSSPKTVHLQAGDAESHSGIDEIRAGLRQHGGYDQGWTGRLDSLFENPDQTIPGNKRYAFGVEGVSHRIRAAVGKAYLDDDRLVDDTVRFFGSISGDGKGRAAWHLVTGWPTETFSEARHLIGVLDKIDQRMRGQAARNLSIHWQPFQPLPGTPMQWCAAGRGARLHADAFKGRGAWCRVTSIGGRTDAMALLCSVLARSDERGADLLELISTGGRVGASDAERVTGSTAGALDPDAPLPWDFIAQYYDRSVLRRAYAAVMRRFTG